MSLVCARRSTYALYHVLHILPIRTRYEDCLIGQQATYRMRQPAFWTPPLAGRRHIQNGSYLKVPRAHYVTPNCLKDHTAA